MKRLVLYTLLALSTFPRIYAQSGKVDTAANLAFTTYVNNFYRFSVAVPDNWKLYGQVLNDTVKHRAIADWGLPPVFSEMENAEIENSISITAYRSGKISSVDELIQAEYLRVDPTKYVMQPDSMAKNARLIYGTIDGRHYKGKTYFVFKNGIGYVVNFMATPGTFDKNLPVFEKFAKTINFL